MATAENRRFCRSCGDPAYLTRRRIPYCGECYDEKIKGLVKNSNVNFFGGRATPEDGASPAQENAIRNMEDSQWDKR